MERREKGREREGEGGRRGRSEKRKEGERREREKGTKGERRREREKGKEGKGEEVEGARQRDLLDRYV